MNDYGKDNINPSQVPQKSPVDPYLEHRISHYLREKANHISFTPAMRMQVMQRISRQTTTRTLPFSALAVALVVILLITGIITYSLSINHTPAQVNSSTTYTVSQTLPVSQNLASGGTIVSLDPTQQHFVYQPDHTTGIFYTANLSDPLDSSTLAMRYAQTMNWSPDGSALVATVEPSQNPSRALALVPTGGYMHVIRPNTPAASWTPTVKNEVTFVTQQHQQTQLWSLDVASNTTHLLTTLPLSLPIQDILWSSDNRELALITAASTRSPQNRAIFLMDAQTHTLHTLVAPGSFTISTVEWSPNNQYLAYTRVDPSGHDSLQIVNPIQPSQQFGVAINRLQGWSWSPDSKNLVYSDSGTLKTYTTNSNHTTTLSISTNDQFSSPFWLKDGRLVCLQLSPSTTSSHTNLVFLSPHIST
jgi:dipeptidyl aminopeptidase/acylaminoacyl peptidase